MQVQVVLGEVVVPCKLHVRAGHTERERAERELLVLQLKFAGHIRNHLVDSGVLRRALAAAAKAVDLVLDGRSQELPVQQFEPAVKDELLADASRERRDIDPGVERYPALHERRTLDGEAQEIAN